MKMEFIAPEKLRSIWALVLPGLLQVAAHAKDTWIPEEVFAACVQKQMMLYVWIHDEKYAGCIVLQKRMSLSLQALHVFAFYVPTEFSNEIHLSMNPLLDDFARSIGASQITFQSPRRGWNKLAEYLGFSEDYVAYSKEL